jgi:hypothetical protein
MAELFLGEVNFTVGQGACVPNCPEFEDLKFLPSWIQSAVNEEAFRVFVLVLDGTDPTLTAENSHALVLLCEEFWFASLRCKVSAFQIGASALDDEGRKRLSDGPEIGELWAEFTREFAKIPVEPGFLDEKREQA